MASRPVLHSKALVLILVLPIFCSCNKVKSSFKKISEAETSTKILSTLGYRSQRARQAEANTQILFELYEVVTQNPPQNRDEFSGLVNALNQGASVEGIYNGFVLSATYRGFEKEPGEPKAEALIAFSKELARLESEMPEPSDFSEKDTVPLSAPVQPGLADPDKDEDIPKVVEFSKKKSKTDYDPGVMSLRYTKLFSEASIYTLKRLLGREALAVIDIKKSDPEKLASWYSKWVIHMNKYLIDFGLQLRNLSDEKFHYNWALSAPRDRLVWEVLNRVHRLMNQLNRGKK
jgi:hypothetical protein